MPIVVECEGCGARTKAPDGSEGKSGRCPRCGRRTTVPGSPDLLQERFPDAVSAIETGEGLGRTLTTGDLRRPRRKRWILIAVGGLAALIVVAGLLTWQGGLFEEDPIRLGHLANSRGDWAEGEKQYRRAIGSQHEHIWQSVAHKGLGKSLDGMKRYREAAEAYREAIWAAKRWEGESEAESVQELMIGEMRQELGMSELLAGQIEEGLVDLAQGVEQYDKDMGGRAGCDGRLMLAKCYASCERYEQANDAIEQAFIRE